MSTPTGILFQNPIVKPLSSNGTFMSGCTATFYLTETTELTDVYADGELTTPLANPLSADASGTFVAVYLNPAITYRVQIKTSAGVLISDTDPYVPSSVSSLTQSALGALLYPPIAAEAGVTIVQGWYPPLYVDRYGVNTAPGSTDMRAPIKTAWNVAKAQGGGVITFAKGVQYALSSLDPAGPFNLANQNIDGTIGTQSFGAQVYCLGGSNITFDFAGAQLVSTITGLSSGSAAGILFDNCKNIALIRPNMTGTQIQVGGVVTLGTVASGSGYVNGTYTNVLMTGGTGQGCCCTIVVSGGVVTSVTPTYPGGSTTSSASNGYQIGDTLSTSNANLGGSGSGFSVPVTSATGAGNVVGTAAVLPFVVTSLSGPSSNITTYDLTATNCYAGFWAIDGQANGNITAGISLLGHTTVINAEYGIPLHNSGDDTFIENLVTFRVNRPHFFYGCQNVVVANLDAQATNFGFGSIIKAYSRPTRNITINGAYRNAPGNATSRVSIQVQCDPAVFPTPPTVKNVYITHDEQNIPSGGNSIEFDSFYSTGSVQASTSSKQLFDQIAIRGFALGFVFSTVKLTTAAAQCQINYDNFESAWSSILGGGQDIRNGLGFIASREFFCNVALTFGGTVVASTGGAVQSFIADGLCKVKGTITLTAKNGSGQAAITLPFSSRLDDTTQSLGQVVGLSNMSALGGTMIGALAPNSSSMLLYTQGATAVQSVVDTNFTTTSSIYFDITYPI